MKITSSPILVLSVMILTLFGPMFIELFNKDFKLLEFLTNVSIPCWLIVFSISWLYHKSILKKSENDLNYYNSQPSPAHATEAKKLFEFKNGAEIRYSNSKASIMSLENATLIAGILAGIINILAYFINKN